MPQNRRPTLRKNLRDGRLRLLWHLKEKLFKAKTWEDLRMIAKMLYVFGKQVEAFTAETVRI